MRNGQPPTSAFAPCRPLLELLDAPARWRRPECTADRLPDAYLIGTRGTKILFPKAIDSGLTPGFASRRRLRDVRFPSF